MNRIGINDPKWSGRYVDRWGLFLVLMLVALLSACSGSPVRIFNEQGLSEQELATVSTSEEEGLFGTSMTFKSVDGDSVSGYFDKGVDVVKVTPGKHTFEVKFHDQSFSLFDSDQHIILSFAFDAVSGHEYVIHFDIDKTVAQRLTFGGSHAGWIEDITSGEKLPMERPD